jgi:hypothetical protein
MKIPVIPIDKANHVVYGAIAAGFIASVCALIGLGPLRAAALAIVGTILLGIAVELRQRRLNEKADAALHDISYMDALATALGAVPVALPLGLLSTV